MPVCALLAVVLQTSQIPPGTYADSGAAHLVAAARSRRERNERLVTRFQATVSERAGIGIRALRRDRTLWRQEIVARLDWRRDDRSRLELVGAREVEPGMPRPTYPDALPGHALGLVFDPSADHPRLMGEDSEWLLHPLSPGSENHYRFASGDTTTIVARGTRTIRLVELRVTPRRDDYRLVAGSFWFDLDTYGLVRAVFRLARPFILGRDMESKEWEEIPRALRAAVADARLELRYVTVEYGFYGGRWWLPRVFAFDGEASVGPVRLPVRLEQIYEIVSVEGGTEPVPGARPPAGTVNWRQRLERARTAHPDSFAQAVAECVRRAAARDSARAAAMRERGRAVVRAGVASAESRCNRNPWYDDLNIDVVVPSDTQSLLTSPELGEPILDLGDVMNASDARELARDIGALPERTFELRAPELRLGLGWALRTLRWNRIEALSAGGGAHWDMGVLTADLRARIGIADRVPNVDLGVTRRTFGSTLRLGGYYRLAAANPEARPFGVINSLNAMLAGRDDGEYFRAGGVELTTGPGATRGNWFEARLYFERQRPESTRTDASLARLLDGGRRSRPNIEAARGHAAGMSLVLRGSRPLGRQTHAGMELTADGVTGSFEYARGSLTARLSGPVAGLAVGLEAAAGSSLGSVPVQGHFFLGGPATLRGYSGGAARGNSFARGRLEVANGFPAWRLAVFSDVGWAGPRRSFLDTQVLWSVGAGTSILEGLIRFDLARGMRGPGGWRFDISVDGVL